MAVNIGQAVAAALEFVGESFVIDSQQVQERGVEVVDVQAIAGDVVAEFVGLAVHDAGLHAAAGHPNAEAAGMMIAAEIRLNLALAIIRASKLAAPDNKRVVEQATAFQIFDECRGGLIGFAAESWDRTGQAAVMIPILVIELNKPHASFGHTPGKQAVGGKGAGLGNIGAIRFKHRFGFLRDVRRLGHARLHGERHFVMLNAVANLSIGCAGELVLVQLAQAVEHQPPALAVDACRIAEIQHRVLRRTKQHALMLCRQEPAAPQMRAERLASFVLRDQHDERWQIRVLLAQSITQPCAHAWSAGNLGARLHERDAGAVIDRFRVHGANNAQIVGDTAPCAAGDR